MHRRLVVLLALVGALVVVVASSAFAAAAAKTTKGSVVSYSKSGTLVVKVKKHRQRFTVSHSTNCGVDHGQSGGPIKCSTLKEKKYVGKPVRVTWTKQGSKDVASLVVVTEK